MPSHLQDRITELEAAPARPARLYEESIRRIDDLAGLTPQERWEADAVLGWVKVVLRQQEPPS